VSSVNLPSIKYTPGVISASLVNDLNNDQQVQAQLETELSTGVLVNQPSDNPSGAASLLHLQSTLARSNQYVTNANDGLGWLSLGNSTLNSVVSSLQTAQQTVLALSGNALSGNQSAITGATAQLKSVLAQIQSLANTSYGNQAIFAGTGNMTQAYDANGNYVGGGSAPTRTVGPGVTVPVSLTGPEVFGTGTTGLLGSTGVLQQLINDIQTGTPASLTQATTTDMQALTTATASVTNAAANLGAAYQRMQGFANQATAAQTALQTQISSIDSVNIAQASTALSQDQVTYQTGLWATSQIEQHSLVNYL
jgi:flagellar hook-associated protein 3 FlgL